MIKKITFLAAALLGVSAARQLEEGGNSSGGNSNTAASVTFKCADEAFYTEAKKAAEDGNVEYKDLKDCKWSADWKSFKDIKDAGCQKLIKDWAKDDAANKKAVDDCYKDATGTGGDGKAQSDGEKKEEEGGSLLWLWITLPCVLVLGGGLAYYFLYYKKN